MKLVTRVAIIIALVAVPAAIIAFSFVYNLLRNEIINPSKNDQLTLTKNNLNTVDRFLEERQVSIAILADSQIALNLANNPSSTPDLQAATKTLSSFVEGTGYWDSVVMVSGNDQILASSSADNSEIEQTLKQNQAVVTKALGGDTTYSNEFVDPSGDQTMIFASPVQNGTAVIGFIKWRAISDVLASLPGNLIGLFNSEGKMIGSSDPEEIVVPTAVTTAGQSKEGIEVETLDNEQFIVSYTSETGYKNYAGNNWIMTISRPAAEVYTVAERLPRALIVSFSLSTLGVMILLTLFIARLLRPINNMTTTANKIALGDLTQRVQIRSSDEFGQLGKAFNNMADRLQLIYKNLESKVQERTNQLAQKVDEVERERAKDEAILSSIGEGMIAVNADGTVAIVNRVATQMLMLDENQVIGKPVLQVMKLLTGVGLPVIDKESPVALALQTGKMSDGVFGMQDEQGKRQIAIVANPIFQDRKIIGAIMIFHDVTKEREIDRMKTEFISLASHQLRTPLSAIKWFSEMLISGDAGKLTEDQTEFAKNIYASTERMIELVNSLLNISRIESGRIIVDPKPTDLKELVNGIVQDLKEKLEQKQQTLIISVHEDLGKINLDPRLISQVYLNFLTNAIKYTPKGGEISVFISRKGDEVVSQVADNGYGIPKAQQNRVFNKFFRAENIVKVETEGTGLGLYLVKAIVESSGGKVWFRSEEGKGTSFWFSLPITGMKARAGEVSLDA
ncbi:MAG TPA: ATP-binding protein [Candidatus Saccharimonadales bacterium]|nr:ATP-binding protein [Candidatus Saccharimonadales bacterium]